MKRLTSAYERQVQYDLCCAKYNANKKSLQNIARFLCGTEASCVHAAAVKCPAVVLRVVSNTDTAVGTVLNVSCPAGQKLTTGHNVTTTFCSTLGIWVPEIPRCIGKILI